MKRLLLLTFVLLLIPLVTADSVDTYCEQAPTGKDNCIKEIAVDRNDVQICQRIEADSVRGSCYEAFANTMQDIDLCRRIPKGARGYDKRNKCYMRFVKTKDDLHICTDLVKTERGQDECYDEILDNNREDVGVCSLFISQKKRLSCYVKVAKRTKNEDLCQLVLDEKDQGRKSQCRYCEVKGIDFNERYDQCKKYFFMKKVTEVCRDYTKEVNEKMTRSEKKQFTFNGENPTRDRFWVTLKQADFQGGIENYQAVIFYSDGVQNEQFALKIGQHITSSKADIGVQLLDLYEQEEGDDMVSYGRICIFRPSSKQGQEPEPEPEEEKEEEPTEEEPEPEVKEEEPKEESVNEIKEEPVEEKTEEPKKELVKIKEGGFFYKLAMVFKRLFG